jgi:predicted nucleotidyltransferase
VQQAELLERVKQAVHEVEPEADIVLYGSRARGDAHAESDWDFLILLDGVVDEARTDAIRHRLYEIKWDCGEVLCSIVRSRQEWDSSLQQATPFAKVLCEQGIRM